MKKIYNNGGKYKQFESELVSLLKDNGINFKTANIKISGQALKELYEEGDTRAHRLMHLYADALEEGGYNKYYASYLFQTDKMSINRLKGYQDRLQ